MGALAGVLLQQTMHIGGDIVHPVAPKVNNTFKIWLHRMKYICGVKDPMYPINLLSSYTIFCFRMNISLSQPTKFYQLELERIFQQEFNTQRVLEK